MKKWEKYKKRVRYLQFLRRYGIFFISLISFIFPLMSLFDDILPQNKSNPPAGSNTLVQNDPLAPTSQITITESVPMSVTAPMVETAPIETPPDTPAPVAQIPVDTSGILIIDEIDTSSPVPVAITSEAPISPVAEVINVPDTPIISSDLDTPANSSLFSLV
jgi:hypothetical protein